MDMEELNLLWFYCWQLEITNLRQLKEFKIATKSQTNKELLNNLAYVFNKM